jgi:methylglutaconyl-CoA hydratase
MSSTDTAAPTAPELRRDRRGHALWLTIDRSARSHAISPAVLAGLSAGLAEAAADDAIRVVVITGAGEQAFCAGADLSKHSGSFQFDLSRPHLEYADLLRKAWACPVPMVARINGHCLTGEPIDAHRAERIGLVNHVVPAAELDAKTEWLVARIADKSPTANRRGKAMMRAAFDMSFEQAISYLESQIMTLAQTEDAREGRAAFVEKRAPNWTGR